jgi:hypothetical protein
MTFSAGRQRRVASPFAQRAAENAANVRNTPDISTVSDTVEPEVETDVVDTPENLEEHPEPSVESTNQEVANEVEGGAQEPTSEAVEPEKPSRGRGRPKSTEVKERDDRVYDAVSVEPGRTRAELEEKLNLPGNDVYMSLFRLRSSGRIERRREGGAHKWYALGGSN